MLDILFTVPAFLGILVILFVIMKLLYYVSPVLMTLSVGVLAVYVFYFASQYDLRQL